MTMPGKVRIQAVEASIEGAQSEIPEKYFVVDTSALEYGMDVFEKLRQGGRNCVLIPYATWEELDSHKTGNDFKADIARNVIRTVRNLFRTKDSSVRFFSYDFNLASDADLKTDKNDHCIIATALAAKKSLAGRKVILMTQDAALETLALHFGLDVQSVKMDQIEIRHEEPQRTTVNLQREWFSEKSFPVHLPDPRLAAKLGGVRQNEGIICYCDIDGVWGAATCVYI